MRNRILYYVLAGLVILMPATAYAYIDPGSGHLITQLIMAAGLGLIFYAKKIWGFFSGRFGKKKGNGESKKKRAA